MALPNLPILEDACFGIVPIYCPPGGALDDAEYLLIQHNAGHWAFPKGHPEGNETPLESACREFTEETGIGEFQVVESVSFQENYTIKTPKKIIHKSVVFYPAFLNKATVTIQEAEIADYRWQTYPAARKLITYDASRNLIGEVYDHLTKNAHLLPG